LRGIAVGTQVTAIDCRNPFLDQAQVREAISISLPAAVPIAGPSQASKFSSGVSTASIVFSSTPAKIPRQPACTVGTRVLARSQSNTGRQSAVNLAHTTPGTNAIAASACMSGTAWEPLIIDAPWICRKIIPDRQGALTTL